MEKYAAREMLWKMGLQKSWRNHADIVFKIHHHKVSKRPKKSQDDFLNLTARRWSKDRGVLETREDLSGCWCHLRAWLTLKSLYRVQIVPLKPQRCHVARGHLPPYGWTLLAIFYLQACFRGLRFVLFGQPIPSR